MPSPNTVLTADSYVQDGLVFQLDGIDYGGIDGQWVDRIGRLVFKGDARHVQTYFHFSGVRNDCFLCESSRIPEGVDYSVELLARCPNATSNSFTLAGSNVSYAWRVSVDGTWQRNKPSKVCPAKTQLVPRYMDGSKCLCAGFSYMNTSTNSGNWNNLKPNVGMQYYSAHESYMHFNGSIYAIRVYSRQLSDREILINQKIDNARFELGLDIPNEVLPANRSLSLSEPFELPDESMTEQDITNENSDER